MKQRHTPTVSTFSNLITLLGGFRKTTNDKIPPNPIGRATLLVVVCFATSANWVRFVIRACQSSTSRRGCFAGLIWPSEQFRSGGELLWSGGPHDPGLVLVLVPLS
jgi:hypothetical protein